MFNKLFMKGLTVGTIVLFIGLTIIPSYNAVAINKDNEETILTVDDIENECIKCQFKAKTHLAEKILNRIEKNEVLSNVIDSIKPQDDRPICILLDNICNKLEALYISLKNLAETFPEGSIRKEILEETAHLILVFVYARIRTIWYFNFNCSE